MTTRSEAGSAGGTPLQTQGRPRLALAVLAGALAVDLSGLAVLNAALPNIGAEFKLADSTLQWTMTAYAVAFAGFLLFSGRAADVLGRRRVFSAGLVLFLVAALGGALAPTITVLVVCRAFQGVGAALSGPAALALITEVFPEGPARSRAFGVYAAAGAASFSGGMILGGVLTDLFGWRSVLLFSVVFAGLIAIAIPAALPAGCRQPQPLDLPGAVLVTGGLLALVFGVSRAGGTAWNDGLVLTTLVAAVVLLLAFVLWERRTSEPLLPMSIFRSVPARLGNLTAFLHYTGSLGLLFFAPLYMQDILGYSPFVSGLAVVPSSLTVFVTSNFFTGRLLVKFGPKPLMAAGLLLIGGSMVAWTSTPLDGRYWLHLLPGLILTGIGQGLAFPAMTAAALTDVPQAQHGVAGAVNVTAQQIGASVGVAALVVVASMTTAGTSAADRLSGYHNAYLVAAIACALGALIVAATKMRGTEETSAPATAQADPAAEEARS